MTVSELLDVLAARPLVASVQASEGSPVEDPTTLARLAAASAEQGVRVLRLQGVENVQSARQATGLPCIGLVKRRYPGSEVYITPTIAEVEALLASPCEVIALDATLRERPEGQTLRSLVQEVHRAGRLAMGDCDTIASVRHALSCGVDLVGTTLAGYTDAAPSTTGPDLGFLREAIAESTVPVLAEGRFAQPWQVQAALRIGAAAVVVGGALNDPVKLTRGFIRAATVADGPVGAVDIGGTWLRFGIFSPDWKLLDSRRITVPRDRTSRLDWIREQVQYGSVHRVGISTGGTVDPHTGEVWEAKPIIPGHAGTVFDEATVGVPTLALNDGLATAWGHANLPQFAGRRVATLALGTGVGCGFVVEGSIWMGPRGEYPRLNDMPSGVRDLTVEQALGGASLGEAPGGEAIRDAVQAFLQSSLMLQEMLFPDEIVVCGGVGLGDWIAPFLRGQGLSASPFGEDAGLYGAAALALFPPLALP
ncbi:MAG TPA: putative N-acetylmannosamine-6-phosphate 2-epimerase [Fimbriimonadaceae bacterium]|nr:putative N-acetylmannosamine-6-phosphate 2-epimerase [Fimbriimonadaceae bacterium]